MKPAPWKNLGRKDASHSESWCTIEAEKEEGEQFMWRAVLTQMTTLSIGNKIKFALASRTHKVRANMPAQG
jgi:hypothetical protein